MSAMRTLNPREKAIMAVMVCVAVCLVFYYGFLNGFIARYSETSASIAETETKLDAQRKVLAQRAKIEEHYDKIKESVLEGAEGKSPEAVFIEGIASFCGATVGIGTPAIEPVPTAREFAFVVLNVSGIQGNLSRLTEILRGFHQRNILVDDLTIRHPPTGRVTVNPVLELQVKVKQLVRVESLNARQQERLKAKQDAQSPRRSSESSGVPRNLDE